MPSFYQNKKTLVAYTGLFILIVASFIPQTDLLYKSFLASISENLIINLTNPHRESSSLPLLKQDSLLSSAAQMKANHMIERGYFSHIDPDGNYPSLWFKKVGYSYAMLGENIAIDFSDPNSLVNAWLTSPTHAENILHETFSDIGIGIASGNFNGRNTIIVVMFLGKKLSTENIAEIPANPPPLNESIANPPQSQQNLVPRARPISSNESFIEDVSGPTTILNNIPQKSGQIAEILPINPIVLSMASFLPVRGVVTIRAFLIAMGSFMLSVPFVPKVFKYLR